MASRIVFDLSGYVDQPERRIEPGKHLMKVVKTEVTVAKASGNQMVNVTLEIMEGSEKGKMFMHRVVNSDNDYVRYLTMQWLRAIVGKNVDAKKLSIDPDKWVGKRVYLTVEDREGTFTNKNGETVKSVQSNVTAFGHYAVATPVEVIEEDDDVVEAEIVSEPADDDDLDLDDLDFS